MLQLVATNQLMLMRHCYTRQLVLGFCCSSGLVYSPLTVRLSCFCLTLAQFILIGRLGSFSGPDLLDSYCISHRGPFSVE